MIILQRLTILLFTFCAAMQVSGQRIATAKSLQSYVDIPLEDILVTDQYTSQGITHIYFHQAVEGLPVLESRGSVHFKGDKLVHNGSHLLRGLSSMQTAGTGSLSAVESLERLASDRNYAFSANDVIEVEKDRKQYLRSSLLSLSDISYRKVWYVGDGPGKAKVLNPAFEFFIEQVSDGYMYLYLVDANTGQVVQTKSLTIECNFGDGTVHKHSAACTHEKASSEIPAKRSAMMTDSSYNVFPWPVESPNHGARAVTIKPWLDNVAASPDGWHTIDGTDYTVTKGNNVDAYIDDDNSNAPTDGDDDRADGGNNLSFDFPLDINMDPALYQDAAVANLFYWSNVIHDVMHNYGFDEASGNFQEVNYGTAGSGGDYVRAEAQDGGGLCNANMSTPADGGNPRMQMYLCNNANPSRDGDFDNGVVIHEYGHGISIRLTGGPSTSGCLFGSEQMGEGWSDYFGTIMTMEAGDVGTEARGMGTYLFGQPANGAGIRPFPYSTDMTINPMTYNTIGSGVSVPHGVGSVWATMLWDMTWLLIDEYGFDTDLYDGTGGNNISLRLVTEGLKLQPCGPGFVDGRDAILAADQALYGGANQCLIWEAFARRGLGFSASQGSSGSNTDGVEAFDRPPFCSVSVDKTANVSEGFPGEQVTYTMALSNNTNTDYTDVLLYDLVPANTLFVSAGQGGTLVGDTVKWPLFDLASLETGSYTFTVQIDPTVEAQVDDVIDDLESGTANWALSASGSTSWALQSASTNSGTNAFFANDGSTPGLANLDLAVPVGLGGESFLSFFHRYDTEATWDGGVVEISTDGGGSWTDLGSEMIVGGYNSTIYGGNGRAGFSGNSNGWVQTVIDLSAYTDQIAIVRMQMNCDQLVGGNGWWIDDITLADLRTLVPNVAVLSSDDFISFGILEVPTKVEPAAADFQVEAMVTDIGCGEQGSIDLLVSGGSGTYTYQWSTGATTAVITNLASGNYTVTISDGVEDISKAFYIKELPEYGFYASGISVTSAGNTDGEASAFPSGGESPYMFLWSTGSTLQSIDNLAGGEYYVTATDAGGCSLIDTVYIGDPNNCAYSLYELSLTFDQYPGDNTYKLVRDDGKVMSEEGPFTAAATGSTITRFFCLPENCYSLEILDSFGDGICGSNSNPDGEYSLTLLDNNSIVGAGCFVGSGDTLSFCAEDIELDAISDFRDVSCNGSNDGRVSVEGVSGTGSYTYLWNTGSTDPALQGLPAGIYTVTVSDGLESIVKEVEVLGSKYSRVLTPGDSGPNSLRGVINNGCVGDTVLFSTDLINDPILLTQGEIAIPVDKTIRGLGAEDIKIDAQSQSRVFSIPLGVTVFIEDVTLQNGEATPDGGNILNEGTLTLRRSALSGGTDTDEGPRAITNKGAMTIEEEVDLE